MKNFIYFFLTTKFLFGQWCPSEKGWNYISYNIISSTPVLKYLYHLLYSTIIYHFSNFYVWNLCFYEMMERFQKHSINIDLNVKNNCAYVNSGCWWNNRRNRNKELTGTFVGNFDLMPTTSSFRTAERITNLNPIWD